jgi:uncharacterized delta-60 repeat protein
MKNTLSLLVVVLVAACGSNGSSIVGASCTKTEECAAGSTCSANKCVALQLPASDVVPGAANNTEEQAAQTEQTPAEQPTLEQPPADAPAAPSGGGRPTGTIQLPPKKPAGTYDLTFGADGVFSYAGQRIVAIASFSNGDFAALTSSNTILKVLRTGVLDTSFASSGVLSVAGSKGNIASIAVSADHLYVFSQHQGVNCGAANAASLAVFAYDAAGQALSGFGTNGIVYVAIAGGGASRIAQTTGGHVDGNALYIAGFTKSDCNGASAFSQAVVAKLNATTGARDLSFGTAGVAAPIGGTIGAATHVVPTASGLLVVGSITNALTNGTDTFVRRLLATGLVDASFPSIGFHSATNTTPRAVTLNGDKLAILSETRAASAAADVYVAQIDTASGEYDVSFGDQGRVLIDRPFSVQATSIVANAGALYIAVQHGDVLANGSQSSAQLWKLTAAGALDTSFDADGIMDVRYGNASDNSVGGFLLIDSSNRACFAGATAAGFAVTGKIVRFSL